MPEFTKDTFHFYYTDNNGFTVEDSVSDDFLTYDRVIAKFIRLLNAGGYTYITGLTVHTDGGDAKFIHRDDV